MIELLMADPDDLTVEKSVWIAPENVNMCFTYIREPRLTLVFMVDDGSGTQLYVWESPEEVARMVGAYKRRARKELSGK